MQRLGPVLAASALAVLAAAPSAFAEVSAADVWAQWQDYAARSGQTTTAESQAQSGGTLTLTGVTFAGADGEVSARMTLDSVVLQENGDGTVAIQLPASAPLQVVTKSEDETVTLDLLFGHQGLQLTASGSPGAIAYDYAAERISVDLTGLQTTAEDKPEVSAGATLEGVEGAYRFGAGEPQPVESAARADRMTFKLDAKAEENQSAVSMSGELADLVATSTTMLPRDSAGAGLPQLLQAGMAASGTLTYGAGSLELNASSTEGDMLVKSSVDGGTLGFQLAKAGLRWNSGSQGLKLEASGSALPLPMLALSLAESGFGLAMPLEKADSPQDVGLLVRLKNLDIDEGLWAMLDPLGQLPHDPLTLILDVTGKATPLVDLLAQDMQSGMAEVERAALLHSLDLEELELTGGGASLTGSGAFTFDNDDLETWGGIPAPEGALDIRISGATKLIDTLTAMGLVPEDQSMMAKMMLGMFTKPAAEPDTVTSRIEVTKDGHISANGQQLQ